MSGTAQRLRVRKVVADALAISSGKGRFRRILPVAPTAAFSPFPPVHRARLERVLRVEAVRKRGERIPYSPAEREFSRFFSLREAIGLEIWRPLGPPQSFHTASVDSGQADLVLTLGRGDSTNRLISVKR